MEIIQGLCGDPIIVWKLSNVSVWRFLQVIFGETKVTRQTLKKKRESHPSIEIKIAYSFSLFKDHKTARRRDDNA